MGRRRWGALAQRLLPDGRELTLYPLVFGRTNMLVGDPRYGWANDAWEFPSLADGVVAILTWDGAGEPPGWDRHPGDGRRRPGGDPSREEVHP